MKKSRGLWIPAVLFFVGFILQAIGTARYVSRLPSDWVGIGLYIVTTVSFAIVAIGFYAGWMKERRKED